MSNYQKPKQAEPSAAAEERPKLIDYWKHLSLARQDTPIATHVDFMEEAEFNTLRLTRVVNVGSFNELRNIQERMNAWFLAGVESEFEHGVGYGFDERLYAWRMLTDLLEMALVGKVHNTCFYALTMANYQGCSSEMAMYQKEFVKRGFFEFCYSYSQQGDSASLDGADIKDHLYAYQVICEFVSHVLSSIQDAEIKAMSNASTPA